MQIYKMKQSIIAEKSPKKYCEFLNILRVFCATIRFLSFNNFSTLHFRISIAYIAEWLEKWKSTTTERRKMLLIRLQSVLFQTGTHKKMN